MDKKRVEIILTKLDDFKNPKPDLEQYCTPPGVAADFLNTVYLNENEKTDILDLGCGTGFLSIAAGLFGFNVRGVDIDYESLSIAEKNKKKAEEESGKELSVDFEQQDISELRETGKKYAVVMNPPFGIQERGKNLLFLEKGFNSGEHVYSLLHCPEDKRKDTEDYIKEFSARKGFEAKILRRYRFDLKNTMVFHQEDVKTITTNLYYFKSKK